MKVVYLSRCEQREFFSTTRKRNLSTACSINILPDEVLIKILSCLTLMEAGRTSILSHRWRNLWQFTSGNIVFRLEQRNAGNLSVIEEAQFVNQMNRVMDLHQGQSIDKLIIHFGILGHTHTDPICRCIHFAMQKKVKVLELAAFSYSFPDLQKFLTISRAVEPKSTFLSLTAIKLVNIGIKDEMVEYLLSKCLHLEQLSLKGGHYLWSLNVVSPSLKSLTIWPCGNLKRLTISAANLVSFEYLGCPTVPSFDFMRFSTFFYDLYMTGRANLMSTKYTQTEFCFENAPKLSEITSDTNYFRALVYDGHLHEPLKKLTLRFHNQVINMPFYTSSTYRVLPRLRCLKLLELKVAVISDASLLFWVLLVMACPLLSTFSVKFCEETSPKQWDMHSIYTELPKQRKLVQKELNSFHHKHLKVVKLMDIIGQMNYIEFAVDLLCIARSLETLIMNPRSDPHRIAILENHAWLLEANLPLGAELVIQ